MMYEIGIAATSAAATGLLSWAARAVTEKRRAAKDRRTVYEWLWTHTRDEPGETHADVVTIAKGTALAEERVRCACMTDARIFRDPNERDAWSVWCAKRLANPQIFVLG